MVTFALLTLFILILYYFVTKERTPTGNKGYAKKGTVLKDGIHYYKIAGINYNFDKNLKEGEYYNFIGSVSTEYNKHDKNAVTVYDDDGNKLGYAPKGSVRLHSTINIMYGGKVLCWGNIKGNDGYNSGNFYVPVGYSYQQLEEIYDKGTELIAAKTKGEIPVHKFLIEFEKLTEL